jgi:cobalt/nickel transport system permease protein
MGFGETNKGYGFLSRLDPRVKLCALVIWSFALALATGFPGAFAGLAGSIALAVLSGPEKPLAFLWRLLAINFFLLFIWLVLPFSMPGEALARLGPLTLTREGLLLSARLSVQALGITAAAMAITTTTGVHELTAAARAMGAPEKLAAMLGLMTRYVAVIKDEFERLVWAMKIRGFRASTSLHCLRSYANLAGVLLVRGLDRGERVYAAMLCRGYGRRELTASGQKFRASDWAVTAGVCAVTLILRFAGA